ncbi:MAG: hypothetical protein ACI4XR_00590 [Bacilli bacterium]
MASEVIVKADKIKKRNNIFKILKLGLMILLIILIFTFIILSVVYKGGKFTVSLDSRLALDSKIVIYEDNELKEPQKKLSARDMEFMDNISIDWLPKDIDNHNGSHNGENYIAYTFYIENEGDETINYWYSIIIDDVIKNVDEASRVMIYLNGEKTVYAKLNSYTKVEEIGTKAFYDKDTAVLEQRKDFSPGMVDKFTIVIWLEGDDPDCTDNILGGEIKMHMEIRGEYKDGKE